MDSFGKLVEALTSLAVELKRYNDRDQLALPLTIGTSSGPVDPVAPAPKRRAKPAAPAVEAPAEVSAPAPAPAPVAPPAAPKVATLEDVRAALLKFAEKHDVEKAKAKLKELAGVEKVSLIPEDQRAGFVAALAETAVA